MVCSLKWQTPGRMKLMRSFPVLKSNTGDDSFIAFASINGNPTSFEEGFAIHSLDCFLRSKTCQIWFCGCKACDISSIDDTRRPVTPRLFICKEKGPRDLVTCSPKIMGQIMWHCSFGVHYFYMHVSKYKWGSLAKAKQSNATLSLLEAREIVVIKFLKFVL